MQKFVYTIVAMGLVLSLAVSCKCENGKENETLKETKSQDSNYTDVDLSLDRDGIEISRDELVVQFSDGISESEKQKLRDSVFAISKKGCTCGNNQIEQWKIDTTKITIEEAKRKTVANSGRGGVNGDHQFYFKVPDSSSVEPSGGQFITGDDVARPTVLDPFVVPPTGAGLRVNIAVVDTGYDLGGNQPSSFLYYSGTEEFNCLDHTSGWNFVEGNADVRDSHSDGHGTFVTKTLMRELDDNDLPYSILPIKAFDGEGKGSYWDIVCALNYIKEIQEINGDLLFVNASFGYDFHRIEEIAKRDTLIKLQKKGILVGLIEELDSLGTIVVASAGNDDLDTDEPGNAHFPSGFTTPNLIGVGGYEWIPISTVGHSVRNISGNYGSVSVDLAAPYKIKLEVGGNSIMKTVTGTSYGTPIVVARIAQFIENGMVDSPPVQKINTFLNSDLIQIHSNFTEKIGGGRYVDSEYLYRENEGVEVEETDPVARDNN